MPSSKENEKILSPEAEKDLLDIRKYTEKTWGCEQAKKYAKDIFDTIGLVQKNPRLGKSHKELKGRKKVIAVGKHYIVFRHTNMKIEIIRIVHQQRDLKRHLEKDRQRSKDRGLSR